MSGKYEKNKTKGGRRKILWIALLAAVLILVLAMVIANFPSAEDAKTLESQHSQTAEAGETEESDSREVVALLDEGLEVTKIGSYTGVYMEDGSDEVLSDILMLQVVNNGETPIQYGEIVMTVGEETAKFTLSTLNPGATMVLLEQNRMAYSASVDYTAARITSKNVALFQYPLEKHADKLEIQILDGAINVTNISGQDIPGTVSIYYKNAADGIYYGGITYVIRLEDGIKADEICQLMAKHFSDTGSEIMFITIAE